MKKRVKRQGKLNLLIVVVLLAVWLTLSAAYAVVRLNAEKESQSGSAQLIFANLQYNLASYGNVNHYSLNKTCDYFVYSGGENESSLTARDGVYYEIDSFQRNKNLQIRILSNGKAVADTNTNATFTFGYIDLPETEYEEQTRSNVNGYMNVDEFRDSMTDRQFETIKAYLTDSSYRNDDSYCELVCTDFYFEESTGKLYPETVQIVRTRKQNSWYVEDTPVEDFKLSPNVKDGLKLHHIGDMERNVIDSRFALGEFGGGDMITPLYEQTLNGGFEDYPYIHTGFLTYVYYDGMYLSLPYDQSDYEGYTVLFAKRYFLPDYCLGDIILASGALFLFLSVIGALLWVMTWKIMEQQLLQEQKRRDVTNALAHDIKTPLFVISGYAQNLKDNVYTEKRGHYADVILQQTESVNALVHRMLELSKLDSADFKPDTQSFDFGELLSEVLESYTILPDGKYIDYNPHGDCIINGDRELMKCVAENLLDNAVKYSVADSAVSVSLSTRGFSVANLCEGIKKSDLKQIWEPYYRLENVSRKDGNGLGLSIVKAILDLHHFKCSTTLSDNKIAFEVEF